VGDAFQRRKPAAIGVKAPYPGFVEPALGLRYRQGPAGERWLHEIKFDGYRVQLHIINEATRVLTRPRLDWTRRFKRSPRCLPDQLRLSHRRRRGGVPVGAGS